MQLAEVFDIVSADLEEGTYEVHPHCLKLQHTWGRISIIGQARVMFVYIDEVKEMVLIKYDPEMQTWSASINKHFGNYCACEDLFEAIKLQADKWGGGFGVNVYDDEGNLIEG